jgi:hypothetical protein
MDLCTVQRKLENEKYTSLDQFNNDMQLIWKNAMTFNKVDSDIFNTAETLKQVYDKQYLSLRSTFSVTSESIEDKSGTIAKEVWRTSRHPITTSMQTDLLFLRGFCARLSLPYFPFIIIILFLVVLLNANENMVDLLHTDRPVLESKVKQWGQFMNDVQDSEIYVSSRGFYNMSTIKNNIPASTSAHLDIANYRRIQDGDLVYVVSDALAAFELTIMPYLAQNISFTLISGDSDTSVTAQVRRLIGDKRIKHMFAQNCVFDHPKITKIPIGMDFHSVQHLISPQLHNDHLAFIANHVSRNTARKNKIYVNLDLSTNFRRRLQLSFIPKDLVFIRQTRMSAIDYYREMSTFRYVFSPNGNGLDCHRTWEAIILGCIPIIQKTEISSLFADLPVIEVTNWNEVSRDLLDKFELGYSKRSFNWNKLKFSYWKNLILNVQ